MSKRIPQDARTAQRSYRGRIYRGVDELLRDLFDFRISLGTVHNIVHSPVAHARRINQQYDLSSIRIGLLDEIFQAPIPSW